MNTIHVHPDDAAEMRAIADQAQKLVMYCRRAAKRMTDPGAQQSALAFADAVDEDSVDHVGAALNVMRDTLAVEGPGYECDPDEADAELGILDALSRAEAAWNTRPSEAELVAALEGLFAGGFMDAATGEYSQWGVEYDARLKEILPLRLKLGIGPTKGKRKPQP